MLANEECPDKTSALRITLLKRLPIVVLSCLSILNSETFVFCSAPKIQEVSTLAPNVLPQRLEAAVAARDSGDPVAIGRASQQVIALALVQMAKIRLDAKAYDEAAKLCSDSLEFEDTAETRVELAIASLYAKKPFEAIKQASVATEMDPKNALAWTIKGEALLGRKDYAGATSTLERSIELKTDAEPLYSLGMAQLGAGAKQKAAETFANLVKLIGDAGWTRVLIGRAYQQRNLSQEAVVEFQNALRLDPRTPNAHYFWAWTLLQADSWSMTPEARSHLQEELRLNPRHFLSIYLLAVFASIERNYDESDRYLRLAREINPSVPEIWMYLGLNARHRHANRSAETYLRKAISLTEGANPKQKASVQQAYFVLGRMLLSSGRKKEGEGVLKEAQKLQAAELQEEVAIMKTIMGPDEPYVPDAENPLSLGLSRALNNAQDSHPIPRLLAGSTRDPQGRAENQLRTLLGSSFNDLATAEALQENYDSALKHYREAESWDSHIPVLQRNLGLAAFFAGQPAEAVRLLSRVVVQMPADAHVRAVLGMAYAATQNFTKAAQTIAPIANQAAQDSQLGFAWTRSLAKTGNRTRAIRTLESLEKAVANADVKSLVQFGQLWQELGKPDRAAQFFQRALLLDPENKDAKCGLKLSQCP